MIQLTASEEVLMAASRLLKTGKREFTEWDLTVETWKLNPQRWGLRGYEKRYPDHKRVMNEIMAKGSQKVVGRGWLIRIRQNYYSLTSAGLAKVETLSKIQVNPAARSLHEYEAITPYANHEVFLRYCKDPAEPKTWLGVAAFLRLKKNDKNALETTLAQINNSIKSALEWIDSNNTDVLRRSDSISSKPISKQQLLKLKEFLSHIELKFKPQFDAIRRKD